MPISVKYTRSWVRFLYGIHLVSAVWLYSEVHLSTSYCETSSGRGASEARVLSDRADAGAYNRLLSIPLDEVL